MAISIKQLLNYSWMSQATYLDFGGARYALQKLIDSPINQGNNFALMQAEQFLGQDAPNDPADGYAFINQRPNTPSGFSATVFASNAGAGYTIAVRGTEPGNDFISDLLSADGLGVVLTGKAIEQLIDAYRYYKQLTSVGTSNIYSEAEITKLVQLYVQTPSAIFAGPGLEGQILSFESALRQDTGLHLIPSGTPINFTGHSLGGHVAALLTEMVGQFDGAARVGDVITYNAPGFDALTYEVQNWLGFNTSVQTGILGTKHLAIIGEGGLEVTSGLGQVNGTKQFTFIEKATLGISLDNHSIVKLGDSFAVKAVLSQLDPNQSAAQLDSILKAASNQPSNSLERTIDVLGKIFGENFTTATDDRNALYANLAALQQSTLFKQAAGQLNIRDLSTFSAAQIISNAQADTPEGLAYRYALTQLNPFTLIGADYSVHNSNGELDRYDPATRQGQLTEQYLKDRSGHLVAKLRDNTVDSASNTLKDVRYRDLETNTTLNPINTELRRITFGAAADEGFSGANGNDSLYGMGGDDTLNGGDGNDYIEGNQGDDLLYGGFGNDTLLGGNGFDTYRYYTGEGNDTLLDTDGLGKVYLGTDVLDGGESQDGGRTWQRSDGAHTYTLISGDINSADGATIKVDGSLTIQHFHQNDLGITLNGATAPTNPNPTNTITGDISPTDFNPGTAGIQAARDAQGNLIGTAAPYEDILVGTAAADHILSGELADNVGGRAGNDWIEGGNGNDYINGNDGDDLIEGGNGTDILAGDAGDDRIYAGTQVETATAIDYGNIEAASGLRGDWLSGGAGADTLIAGADNDVLAGGGGDDTLIAGAGDDHILGDSDYTAQYILEANPRYTEGGTDWYHTSTAPFNWTITPENGTTTFAPVTGEAPNLTANGACPDICRRAGSEAANDSEWRMQA